ncbi:MAG TPA: Holliday junction resolvase RuvX [Anaerolineales bacterium]|nr:Holliday junction resolvase RuvX [Anaerolineales bacterium]
MSRVLAIDPGEARLGLAISDPTRTIARPLRVLQHETRNRDAARIVAIATQEDADLIVIGIAYAEDGEIGHQARRAMRLKEALALAGAPTIETWDESGSTQAALALGPEDSLVDARAAAILLQEYLDAHRPA